MIRLDENIERSVLGSLLLRNSAIEEIDFLEAKDFVDPRHKLVFQSIQRLHKQGKSFDLCLVTSDLIEQNEVSKVGDLLDTVTNNIASTQNIRSHAIRVKELSRDRQIREKLQQVISDGDIEAELPKIQALCDAARVDEKGSTLSLINSSSAHNELVEGWKFEQENPGVSTGLQNFDSLLGGGLRGGDMIALSAAAGGGKSAFLGQVAYDTACNGAIVLYFSFEMPVSEVHSRILSRVQYLQTGKVIDSTTIQRGTFDENDRPLIQDASKAMETAAQGRLLIAHPPSMITPVHVENAVREARARFPEVKQMVVVLDAIQRLMLCETPSIDKKTAEYLNRNETDRVGILASEIKRLADNENLAVLCASDTTKSGAAGGQSSSQTLRGSYMLNHVCTIVGGIHTAKKPDELALSVYGDSSYLKTKRDGLVSAVKNEKPEWTTEGTDNTSDLYAHIEISKNRRGKAKDLNFIFRASTMSFFDKESTKPEGIDNNA